MKLDNRYSIDKNGTLIFLEMREVIKKDGTKAMETYTDKYYYPNVATACKKYLDLTLLENSKDVKDCINLIAETYKRIEKCLQSV